MDFSFIIMMSVIGVVLVSALYMSHRMHGGPDSEYVNAKPQTPEQIARQALSCTLKSFEETQSGKAKATHRDLSLEIRRFSAVLAANTDSWFAIPEQLHEPWRDLVRSHADYHRLTEMLLGAGGEFQTHASTHMTDDDIRDARRRYETAYEALFDEKPTLVARTSRETQDQKLLKARHGRFRRTFRKDGEKIDRGALGGRTA